MKLQKGDKVWVTLEDGALETGWVEWDGVVWLGPCGRTYSAGDLLLYLADPGWWTTRPNYHHMAEALIAEGAM